MRCRDCQGEVISLKGCAYEIVGFEVERKQGGANHIWRRKRTGRVMCKKCTTDMTVGVAADPNQLTLP